MLLILIVLSTLQLVFPADPIIEIPNGKIQGIEAETHLGTRFYSFYKIPYAEPPIGELRFKAPQPIQNWNTTLNGTVLDVTCFQLHTSDTELDGEDCLFVNIHTPRLPSENAERLPVMLFIHGGAFIKGNSMYPPDLFIENDVLLVTISYRLGPFGFLSTEDEIIPGNNGLKDQKLAFRWVHKNIHYFGGDGHKITIFGRSAGSASVSYLLLQQDLDGLIKGAIMESGTFLCPWSYQRNAKEIAFGTAAVLNSSFSENRDSNDLLEFLQSVSSEDLDYAAGHYFKLNSAPWELDVSQGSLYAPVIEVKNPDAFLTKKMYGLLKAENILKVPVIVGFNSEESLLFNKDKTVFEGYVKEWDQNLDIIVNNNMRILDPEQHYQMAEKIRDIYTNGRNFSDDLSHAIRYSTDTSFTRPIRKFGELYSQLSETYFYQFSYDGISGGVSVHYEGAESVGHTEESAYMFCSGKQCSYGSVPAFDLITSKRMIKFWTNFAKYQNPTLQPVDNITWPKLDISDNDFQYLNFNKTMAIENRPKDAVYQKWIELYESLDFEDFDTY